AVRGYLKIKEVEGKAVVFKKKDYIFYKLKEFSGDKTLNSYEKKILEGIFSKGNEVKLSELKNKFYQDLKDIKKFLYNTSILFGYFKRSPEKIRNYYLTFGIVVFALGIFLLTSLRLGLITAIVSFMISGLIIIAFSFFMPRKTKKGVLAYEHALGFKLYLEKAEKYRLKFAEKENIFEKYLPYAMIFGVADKWAKAFADIYKNPPSWYEGYGPGPFNAVIFASSMNDFSRSTNSTFVSAPKGAAGGTSGFGGGGFSGGGFGGGGGGSW
ncbi:MAG: DUF2207 domain-containing protein, partial [Candidatus Aenigmarchaeota archaeon]|nr:DUF2207 domain-containing protein [Candidatus Aenigmarchaeota archaeon]